MPPRLTVTLYSRNDVVRILHLHSRQIAGWERAGLVPVRSAGDGGEALYSFEDLAQMRALRDLQHPRMTPRSIRASVDAMQRVAGMRNPLIETSAVRQGSRLRFRYGGALMDPMTRQLAFDFEVVPARQLRVVRAGGQAMAPAAGEMQELFLQAVRLEEDAATREQAAVLYGQILEADPGHAASCINLGTIFYTQREFVQAETMYRRATIATPDYALAFFDLGNVLDELQRLPEAIEAYARAVQLVPTYADAHYNLALAYERKGERRRALRHWETYVRLDPVGPWSSHAKGQAKKILSAERLAIVSRGGIGPGPRFGTV